MRALDAGVARVTRELGRGGLVVHVDAGGPAPAAEDQRRAAAEQRVWPALPALLAQGADRAERAFEFEQRRIVADDERAFLDRLTQRLAIEAGDVSLVEVDDVERGLIAAACAAAAHAGQRGG